MGILDVSGTGSNRFSSFTLPYEGEAHAWHNSHCYTVSLPFIRVSVCEYSHLYIWEAFPTSKSVDGDD